jgi:hypothetical protein
LRYDEPERISNSSVCSCDVDRTTGRGRFVDRHHDLHVLEPLEA